MGKFRRLETNNVPKKRNTSDVSRGRKIWKFFYRNMLLAISAFLTAAIAVLFIVVSLKMESSPLYDYVMDLRGAAVETSDKDLSPTNFDSDSNVYIELRNEGDGYAYQGDLDVVLMRLNLTPRVDSRLMGITLRASTRDLKTLQLYFDDQYVDSVPVYDGKARFEELWVKLDAGVESRVVIKGEISETASPGDDVSVSINQADDIVFTGDLAKKHDANVDFPLYGRELRVIGNQI